MPAVRRASFRTQTQVPWKRKLQFAPSHSLDYKRSVSLSLSLSLVLSGCLTSFSWIDQPAMEHGARETENSRGCMYTTILPMWERKHLWVFLQLSPLYFCSRVWAAKKTTTSEQWKEKQYNQVNRCSVRVGGDETETLFGSVPRRRVVGCVRRSSQTLRAHPHTHTHTYHAPQICISSFCAWFFSVVSIHPVYGNVLGVCVECAQPILSAVKFLNLPINFRRCRWWKTHLRRFLCGTRRVCAARKTPLRSVMVVVVKKSYTSRGVKC